MKKISGILFGVFLGMIAYATSPVPLISFEYDNDGNMKSRKKVVVTRSAILSNTVADSTIDAIGEQKVIFYPNPTKGVFRIAINPLNKKVRNYYTLYSLSGALLVNDKIVSELTEVDITEFASGTYLLDVFLGEKVSRWKVIKE